MKKIIKFEEMKDLLEFWCSDFLGNVHDNFVNEKDELDWEGDGSEMGLTKTQLIEDFKGWVEDLIKHP